MNRLNSFQCENLNIIEIFKREIKKIEISDSEKLNNLNVSRVEAFENFHKII